jgi:hypothetical protein
MKKVLIKKDNVSVTLDPKVMKLLKNETNNNSKFIEKLLLNYFNEIGKDIKNIMI